jgi:PhnB protein
LSKELEDVITVETTTAFRNVIDERHIRDLIDEHPEALQRKDAAAVVSHYTPDSVMFTLVPPLQTTPETSTGRSGVEQWFAGFDGPLGFEMCDLHIAVGDDVGFCHSLLLMTATQTDGTRVDMWYRDTLGLRKTDGGWKIAHQHESVPFFMDGGAKAATDLKP